MFLFYFHEKKYFYTLFTPGAENPWVKLYENCL